MYAFYEHFKDPSGKILATEIIMSSKRDSFSIAFYNNTEKAIFELAKTILKMPPIGARSYDTITNIWSYNAPYGEQVLVKLPEVTKAISAVECLEVSDLQTQNAAGYINWSTKHKPKLSAEEFFYNHGVAQSAGGPTKEQIVNKLIMLLELQDAASIDKRAYRQAALRLHPDRNNGDGTRMSELNMYWVMYNQ